MAGKRRGNREGSIGLRADGRWCARYSLPGGKRRYIYGKTREDVARNLAVALRDVGLGLGVADSSLTVGVYLMRWLDDVRPSIRPRTHDGYAQHVRDHLTPTLGRVKLGRLGPAHIRQLFRDLDGKGLSATTIGRVRSTLRAALAQAERDGLVPRNVARLVKPPKVERQERAALTVDAARGILAGVEGDRLGPLITLALLTGLRQGELLGLQWSDVDLDARTLTVRHALQRRGGRVELVAPKSSTSRRVVDLPDAAATALRQQRASQGHDRLVAGLVWTETGHVFTSTIGTPMDGASVTRGFQALLAAAGLPRMRFHDLRHGATSILLALGVPVETASKMMGHADASMTLRVYAHSPRELQRDAADRLGAALTGDGAG